MDLNLWCFLRLLQIKGLGVLGSRKLIDVFDNVSEIFDKKNEQKMRAFFPKNSAVLKQLFVCTETDRSIIENEIKFMKDNRICYVDIYNENYPPKLKECVDAPIILFYRGNMEKWPEKAIGIVGTRKASAYGINFTQQFTNDLKNYQPLIVSGLALGIDIKAHLSAINNGLFTVAVMGTSFKTLYPKKHLLQAKLIEENGLLISEYPSWSKLVPEFFIRRNRLIAGLSDAVLIVQSAKKGGSLSTALYANDYNRDVFAVPGRFDDVLSEGAMWLIQSNRAKLILNASDVINDLNWDKEVGKSVVVKKEIDYSSLNNDEKRIVQLIEEHLSLHIDDIALKCTIEMAKLNGILMMLEINGVIKSLPGKIFSL